MTANINRTSGNPKKNLPKTAQSLPLDGKFPSTRYAGSKRRLLCMLHEVFRGLDFTVAFDAFSGTSCVGYLLKKMRKRVISNDYLWSNYWAAVALVENNGVFLTGAEIDSILNIDSDAKVPGFITKTFSGMYFTEEENSWLDQIVQNIIRMSDSRGQDARYKQAMAYHSLFQSALRKRPFNMFHRNNLYLRLAKVDRQFGNSSTWERPFSDHFKEIAEETNSMVFSNGDRHNVFRNDILTWDHPPDSDLVYVDPPYVWPGASRSEVDYVNKYHFLEGLARYQEWSHIIDSQSPILQVKDGYSVWPGASKNDSIRLFDMFTQIITKYQDRTIVFSYREPGVPTISQICDLMKQYKKHVHVAREPYKYALRKPTLSDTDTANEVVIVGTDSKYYGPGSEV